MPRFKFVVVIAAAVLAMFVFSGRTDAVPAQSFCTNTGTNLCGTAFPVDWNVCYDSTGTNTAAGPAGPSGTPGLAADCAASTSNVTVPNTSTAPYLNNWEILSVPAGSRLVKSMAVYSPAPWAFVPWPPFLVLGNVSLQTDLKCDGIIDTMSSGLGTSGPWPANGWGGFGMIRQGVPATSPDSAGTGSNNAYIAAQYPFPPTFTLIGLDRANVRWSWDPTPLQTQLEPDYSVLPTPAQTANWGWPLQFVTANSPYVSGMHVTAEMMGTSDNPPDNKFQCIDSPQNSVIRTALLAYPATPNTDYLRWAVIESQPDLIDGQITRVLQTRCVHIGVGVCSTDIVTDSDKDLVPNAVETLMGTKQTIDPTDRDTDADGATDFDELFQFTDPGCLAGAVCGGTHPATTADTDGDGSLDKQDELVGFNCISVAGACSVANLGDDNTDDNCPGVPNGVAAGGQLNSDSLPDNTNSPNVPNGGIYRGDATNPHQDHQGDACDIDDDNDGLTDTVEINGFWHPNVQPGCAAGAPTGCVAGTGFAAGTQYCLSVLAADPPVGMTRTPNATDSLNPDSDSDGGLDGRECQFGSDPLSAVQGSCQVNCTPTERYPVLVGDTDFDALAPNQAETFYRTQNIRLANGAELLDLESLDAATTAKVITTSGVGNPTLITTSAAHMFVNGDLVEISLHFGGASIPTINGTGPFGPFVVSNATTFTFNIPVNVTVGGNGGTVVRTTCPDPNATPRRCDDRYGWSSFPADPDSDGDKLNDGVEVKWYGTSPANYDTDGDGCLDGKEAADVNGDHKVDSTDGLAISQHFTTGALRPGSTLLSGTTTAGTTALVIMALPVPTWQVGTYTTKYARITGTGSDGLISGNTGNSLTISGGTWTGPTPVGSGEAYTIENKYPLGRAVPPAPTTLAAILSPTDVTSMTLTSVVGFASVGKVRVGGPTGEVIGYTGIDVAGSKLTGLIRGENSTVWPHDTAVLHSGVGIDLVTAEVTAYNVGGTRRTELAVYDISKDGKIDSTDVLIRSQISGGAGGGGAGNCKFGTGAQTYTPAILHSNR